MSIQDSGLLTVNDFTGGGKCETGIFEELMRAVKSHLSGEYEAGRITGQEYTSAYVTMVQAAMTTGAQYMLQHKLTNAQIALIEKQIETEDRNADLVTAQIEKLNADTAYTVKNTTKLDSDIALVDANIEMIGKQELLVDEQILNATKDLEVKDAGITYQGKQGDLVDQQVVNAINTNDQITAQTAKLGAEKLVLDQRAVTEEAQTKDTVSGQPVGGVIGKQMELYNNQAEGYLRDAEQRAAKMMNDTFVSRVSTDWDNPDASNAGLDDAEVKKVFDVLKAGIGVI